MTEAREAPKLRRIVPHTPRPAQIGRVLEKAGFSMVREMDDAIEPQTLVRVVEWN